MSRNGWIGLVLCLVIVTQGTLLQAGSGGGGGPELTLMIPMDLDVSCEDDTDPGFTGMATASGTCGGITIMFTDTMTGSCPVTIMRDWMASDACGNSLMETQVITVLDDTPPVITGPSDLAISCLDDSSPANTGAATAMDSCDSSPPMIAYTDVLSGSCPQTIERSWTATDGCGNVAMVFQVITLTEVPPILNLPPDVAVSCGGDTGPASTGVATFSSGCPRQGMDEEGQAAAAALSGVDFTDDLVGSCPQSIERTWVATDACGNTSSGVQTITVLDGVSIMCPGSQQLVVDGSCEAVLPDYTSLPSVTSCCGHFVSQDPPAGTMLSLAAGGTSGMPVVVTFTAESLVTEASSTCDIIVDLIDNTAPTVQCPAPVVVAAATGAKTALVTLVAMADDNCDISSVFNDFNGGMADASGDYPIGTTTVTFTAVDWLGNGSSCSTQVIVSALPELSISDASVSEGDSGQTDLLFTVVLSQSSTQSISFTYMTMPVSATARSDYLSASANVKIPAGNTEVTLTVAILGDEAHELDETFLVKLSGPVGAALGDDEGVGTIEDDDPVSIECPPTQYLSPDGQCQGLVPDFTGLASVPCCDIQVTQSLAAGTPIIGLGLEIVTLTATSLLNGETATCMFEFIYDDTSSPDLTCPGDVTVLADPGGSTAQVNLPLATGVDNCTGVVTFFNDFNDGGADASGVYPLGETVVTFMGLDATGNTDLCSLTVTVLATRTDDCLLVLYDFLDLPGLTVEDVSGETPPIDLNIAQMNAVSWLPGGGLRVLAPTFIKSPAPATRVVNACTASNELTVEAWVRAANVTQDGPARIVSCSLNGQPGGGNFVLGQSKTTFLERTRTTTTNQYGFPNLATGTVVDIGAIQHLVYTRSANGAERLYVDGNLRTSGVRPGNFAGSWGSYVLSLANEPNLDVNGKHRAWLGDLHLVAIYKKALTPDEVQVNYLAGFGPSDQPPSITAHPASQTVPLGQPASFSVTATGTPTLAYQWQELLGTWMELAGQESQTLTIPAVQASDAGRQFRCVVTNAVGLATSNAATLSVQLPAPASFVLELIPAAQAVPQGTDATLVISILNDGGIPLAIDSISASPMCDGLLFLGGDDNSNDDVDPGEDWHYRCTVASVQSMVCYEVTVTALPANPDPGAGTLPLVASAEACIDVFQAPACNGPLTLIPGRLEVEDFRNGGQGVAYNDTTPGNAFGGCRNEDVDLGSPGGGHCVLGNIAAGEWLEYCVSIASARSYDLLVRHASALAGGGRLRVEIDGVNVIGPLQTGGTGGWGSYQTLTVPGLVLPAGVHVLRIFMVTSGFNLDHLDFVESTGPTPPGPIPNNRIANGGFEAGTTGWSFFSNGAASFQAGNVAFAGTRGAQVFVTAPGTNVQLYQAGIAVTAGRTYRLRVSAFSSTGHNLEVSVHKHTSPWNSYGLPLTELQLTSGWTQFTLDFVANATATDGRLRFWLAPFDAAGDQYFIDEVSLIELP